MIGELLAASAGGAMAYFRTRERRPRSVLIWSPHLRMTAVSTPGTLHADRWLMAHLEAGFRPVRASLDEAALPLVEAGTGGAS
jgi:hypothetical protein